MRSTDSAAPSSPRARPRTGSLPRSSTGSPSATPPDEAHGDRLAGPLTSDRVNTALICIQREVRCTSIDADLVVVSHPDLSVTLQLDGGLFVPRTAHRVVMVRSSHGGSGYRISDDLVLTAAHVVGESGEVKLFDTENWLPFRRVWHDDDLDVAVLKLDAIGLPAVPPTRWGLLSSGAPRVLVEAHGFPTFQVLGEGAPRDYEQIDGHVNPLSGAARRQFHVSVDSKLWRSGPHPWPGMSGAPVLCDGRLIGVVAETVGDSPRLAATPITEFILDKGDAAGTSGKRAPRLGSRTCRPRWHRERQPTVAETALLGLASPPHGREAPCAGRCHAPPSRTPRAPARARVMIDEADAQRPRSTPSLHKYDRVAFLAYRAVRLPLDAEFRRGLVPGSSTGR
jgi:hypothetical protein